MIEIFYKLNDSDETFDRICTDNPIKACMHYHRLCSTIRTDKPGYVLIREKASKDDKFSEENLKLGLCQEIGHYLTDKTLSDDNREQGKNEDWLFVDFIHSPDLLHMMYLELQECDDWDF